MKIIAKKYKDYQKKKVRQIGKAVEIKKIE